MRDSLLVVCAGFLGAGIYLRNKRFIEYIMIKKITIISIMTITILFSSFYYQQKKAEAVVPVVLYVVATALIHFAVGAYIYLQSQSGGNDEGQKITGINFETGEIMIDFVDGVESTTNGVNVFPAEVSSSVPCYPEVVVPFDSENPSERLTRRAEAIVRGCKDWADIYPVTNCTIEERQPWPTTGEWVVKAFYTGCNDSLTLDQYTYNSGGGSLGGVYDAIIEGENVEMYEFIEDVPLLPNCFDGIQNQDETGIDCGGVCEFNFGLVCPPDETCFDGIMNQDETGIDYGGVCGIGGEPAPAGPEPTNFVDVNVDGIDDLSGYDSIGNVPIGTPGDGDSSTYDTALPGDISEIGETNWTGLIIGFLSSNPLVLLATGSSINLSGEECILTANIFGTDIVIDFCSMEVMINMIGTFVLALFTIRSVFIAMGI